MGNSPHGLVFYGFALVDEDGEPVNPWANEDDSDDEEGSSVYVDWQERLAIIKGAVKPGHTSYDAPEWKAFHDKQNGVEGASPVDVVLAGYGECLIDCIVIKESYVRADWGEVLPIKTLEALPEWDEQIREWCKTLGIEYRQPGWFVAALYF